ncbi:MAG TPA: oligosaccharide flippase family protein [Tepidisphaeraceae bacterium]|jgi:O-antigen/teichoic acid export membrane protein
MALLSSDETASIVPLDGDEELKEPFGARPRVIAEAPLGAAAARGFYWQSSLSVLSKIISMVSQIVLSWFLSSTDFGLISNSTTFASAIWLIQDGGLLHILIKRRRFGVWATPIFWLTVYLGLTTAVLVALAGFIAAKSMHEHALCGLMLILALRGILSSPSIVPIAQVTRDMRFALLATVGTTMVALERGLAIFLTLPWLHWGAYGVIIAMTIVSGVRTVVFWWYARTPIRKAQRIHRWKYVARDNLLLLMSQSFQYVTSMGDNLLMAFFCTPNIVGDYYWAFNLSMQTTMLLTYNLGGVLYSTLTRLQREPARMRQAFVRAARMLTMIGIPGCFLQAAMARPLVEFFFKHRWDSAIPALQVLSIGMAMSLINIPAISLIRAQGRFATERTMAGICAGIFLIAAFCGASLRSSLTMAIAVAIYNVIAGTLYVSVALEGEWQITASIFAWPLILASLAIACGYVVARQIPLTSRLQCIEQMLVLAAVATPLYMLGAWKLMPDVWAEAKHHLRPILRRLRLRRA